MFDSTEYPKSLDEAVFDSWLEHGRASKIPYAYLLLIWDELDEKYSPVYVENRSEIDGFEKYGDSAVRQVLVAAYDLYSESRVF
jgi:hypothetical protein